MLKNYLKIAWRNLLKNKVYSLLNISGLAVGMTVALLIALWVVHEFSYDKFLEDYQLVYQVKDNATLNGKTKTTSSLPLPLADVLRKEIPEIEYVAETDWIDGHGLLVGGKKIVVEGAMAGSDFLKIFKFPLLKGNAATVLEDPYSIVLTAGTAKALFGNQDPMNQLVVIDNENNLKVTGILKDLPENTSIDFDFIVPFSYLQQTSQMVKETGMQWEINSFQMFVKLRKEADEAKVSAKVKNIIYKNSEELRKFNPEVLLQPLSNLHLYNKFENGKQSGGYIEYVNMFGFIGTLVLLIACINFMNLSTARSVKRSMEVGIRKALGSRRHQLIFQFLTESVLIVFLAFAFSLCLSVLVLPYFNELTHVSIEVPFDNPVFWLLMLIYIFGTGILAGIRPAFYLSSFNTIQVLKGTIRSGRAAAFSRKVLVVLQFSCSIALIISTIIIYQQIEHARNRPLGYDANRLMTTRMSNDLNKNYQALKNDLLKTGIVESITKGSCPLSDITNYPGISNWPGKTADKVFMRAGIIYVGDNYFNAIGIKIKSGSNFSENISSDTSAIIVNEMAVREMGLKEPLNQVITVGWDQKAHIIGVVKDAVMESPFDPVIPLIYAPGKRGSEAGFMFYRLSSNGNIKKSIATIRPIFNQYNPSYSYSYSFSDDEYDYKFKLEGFVGKLAAIFSILAVFISCLGLFGLAAYTAEQRTKEIGVRKVLGASVGRLWFLLCKDFVLLVIISCIIASPIAFYFLQDWLQKYDYRISIEPAAFIIAAFAALIITIATISYQAIKAAIANPVKSLKTE